MCITRASHVHHTCITCASHVHHMCITRASHVHHTCITRASHVHHMCITCASHVHHMCITCASHVHHMCITWWWGMVLACFHSLFISPRQPSHWSHDRFLAILLLHVAAILVHSSSTSGVHCWNLILPWRIRYDICDLQIVGLGCVSQWQRKETLAALPNGLPFVALVKGWTHAGVQAYVMCIVASELSALQTFLFYLVKLWHILTFFLRFSFCAPWCGMCFSVAEACSCSHLYAQLWHSSEPSLGGSCGYVD